MKQVKRVLIYGIALLTVLTVTQTTPQLQAQEPTSDDPITVNQKTLPLVPQIVGGNDATVGEYPWQVLVQPSGFLCGGSLIDEEWVLTAAHCVVDGSNNAYDPSRITVTVGEYDRNNPSGTEIAVTQVIPHESYNPATFDNDIALLRLAEPADTSDPTVGTIPLNSQSNLASGTLATVTGWGTTSSGGSTSAVLQEVNVPLVTNQSCNLSYGGQITSNMLCAGYDEGGRDACQGDSGGPLTVEGASGTVLAGVVSWGNGCADPDFPGVYARVSNYVQWVNRNIGTSLATPTPAPTATPLPSGSTDLIADGSFELNDGSWNEYSSNGFSLIEADSALSNVTAFDGGNIAWLGGADDESTELSQSVFIPSGVAATLSYSYWIESQEGCGSQVDTAQVQISAIPVAEYELCTDNATGDWVQTTIDLTGRSGSLTLEFSVETNFENISSFFLDTVSLTIVSDGTQPTPTPTATPTATQIGSIANGDFELGDNGDWLQSSTNFDTLILNQGLPVSPRSGEYLAWLGEVDNETSILTQSVTIPNDTNAALTFHYIIDSVDNCGLDFADVIIDGAIVATYDLCRENNTTDWVEETISLSSYAGQTVSLEFSVETDSSGNSNFFVDDVSLSGTTIVPTPTPPVTQVGIIANGDFELGNSGDWAEFSTNFDTLILNQGLPVRPRSGEYLAWLGGGISEISQLVQSVTVPNDTTAALTFYYRIGSQGSCGVDYAEVRVNDDVVAEYDLCNDNLTTDWVAETISLSRYAGQTVSLEFFAETDDTDNSNFFVDDVSFTGTTIAPTATPGPTATPVTSTQPGVVVNGGFEDVNDFTSWLEESFNNYQIILPETLVPNLSAYQGAYLAWLGGATDNETARLTQYIEIPAAGATLSYFYQIQSSDFCGYDVANILIDDSPVDVIDLCEATETREWQENRLDLSNFAGQVVKLTFEVVNDLSFSSNFFVDEVSLIDVTLPTPTPTPSPTPGAIPTNNPLQLTAEGGSASIELDWNITNNPNVVQYRVGRRPALSPQGTTFTPVATTQNTSYIDADTSLVVSTDYCYRVQGLDASSNPLVSSNTACATFGALELWMPNVVGQTGETVIAPINIRNADGLQIGSADIWLDYDSAVVELATDGESVRATALTLDYAWQASQTPQTVNGTIKRLKISTLNTSPPEIFGDGTLFQVRFRVIGGDNDKSDLDLREFFPGVGGSIIRDDQDMEISIAQLIDGRLVVEDVPSYRLGDVSGDGLVDSLDARIALRLATQERQPTQAELSAGDINGNGVIQASDASAILFFAANNAFPSSETATTRQGSSQVNLSLSNLVAPSGGIVTTTVRATGLSNLASGDFGLTFDPSLLNVTNVQPAGLTQNFPLDNFNNTGDGRLFFSLADDNNSLNGDGVLAILTLQLTNSTQPMTTTINFADASLSDVNGRDFVRNFSGNSLVREGATVVLSAGAPGRVYVPIVLK